MANDGSTMSPEDRGPTPLPESKSKLTKKLPTFRVGLPKQLEALRVYGGLSEQGTKTVHYSKVAEIIKVHEANVSSMNPFFLENGFIEKQGAGYMPTAAVVEYHRAYSWNPETAGQKLAPIVAGTWFGQAILRRLQFRPMPDDEAIEVLATECMAGPDALPQLKMLLSYCETAGVLQRENGQLLAAKEAPMVAGQSPSTHATPAKDVDESKHGGIGNIPIGLSGGAINFQVSVQVDLAQMKGWSADRIASFFAGIAQVLAAQDNKGSG